jgi:peptidoglycan/xylan/chitin deacetylase (PgdA/CDA1 family)
MKRGAKSQLLIILFILVLSLLLQTPPASNAQVTSGAQVKRVIFRDDDVTPMTLSELKALNQVHIDEGVPVTLGVIPAQSFPALAQGQCGHIVVSEDSSATFVAYLRSLTGRSMFELAQHGYEHCNNRGRYNLSVASEFRGMPYSEQYRLIEEGRNAMQSAFGAAPTTFIPPFNAGDENTLTALSNLGFTVYSSYTGEFTPTNRGNLTLKPQSLTIYQNETFESLVNQTEPLLSNPSVNDIVIIYHNWRFPVDRTADAVDAVTFHSLTFPVNRTAGAVNASETEVLREYMQYLKTKNVEFTTLDGTHPSPQATASPPSVASTSAVIGTAQRSGDPWGWAILAFLAPLLVATLLIGLMKRVK